MKLVFRETTGNAISFHTIRDFYDAAKTICHESFVVTAPEELAKFIIIRVPGKYFPFLLFMLEVTDFDSPEAFLRAKERLTRLAKGYDFELVKTFERDAEIESEIREEMLEWFLKK